MSIDLTGYGRRMGGALAIAGILGAAAPVGESFLGVGDLEVTLEVSRDQVGVGGMVAVTVTAVNTSGRRVVWGEGSSSCQLGAVVRVAGIDRRIDLRACTTDLAPHGLEPGETRTENWWWEIEYDAGPDVEPLPPGEYRLYGLAGDRARSRAVKVRVANAQ